MEIIETPAAEICQNPSRSVKIFQDLSRSIDVCEDLERSDKIWWDLSAYAMTKYLDDFEITLTLSVVADQLIPQKSSCGWQRRCLSVGR